MLNNQRTATAKSLQLCLTLCDPVDVSPPGSPAPGILQARTLEWVAISFSNACKWKSESEVAQLCPTLSDPMDCSLPSSSIPGIFQARVLEWGAIAFSSSQLLQILYLPNISMRANFILISHISSQVNAEDSGICTAHSYVCTSSWQVFQLTYLAEIWEGWIGNTLRENKVMHINQFREAKWALFCCKNIS